MQKLLNEKNRIFLRFLAIALLLPLIQLLLSAWTRASVLSFQSFGYFQFIIIAEKQNRENELMHRNPEPDAENEAAGKENPQELSDSCAFMILSGSS